MPAKPATNLNPLVDESRDEIGVESSATKIGAGVPRGKSSLAVARGPARTNCIILSVLNEVYENTQIVGILEHLRSVRRFRSLIDVKTSDQEGKRELQDKLSLSLEETPFEDGINHPAESIIDRALKSTDEQTLCTWLKEFVLDVDHPTFASEVLRCLSRTEIGSTAWRTKVVQECLAKGDIQMRDAAVQAAESWGGSHFCRVLRDHVETLSWLRDYLEEVVKDLEA